MQRSLGSALRATSPRSTSSRSRKTLALIRRRLKAGCWSMESMTPRPRAPRPRASTSVRRLLRLRSTATSGRTEASSGIPLAARPTTSPQSLMSLPAATSRHPPLARTSSARRRPAPTRRSRGCRPTSRRLLRPRPTTSRRTPRATSPRRLWPATPPSPG